MEENQNKAEANPLMIKGLHHVQITIPEGTENEAREFYCGTLGFREIERPAALRANKGFWLELPDRQLHIGVENGIDRHLTKAHVAYEVEAIDLVRKRIEKMGMVVKEQVTTSSLKRFKTRDPFGNQIEFIEKIILGDSL